MPYDRVYRSESSGARQRPRTLFVAGTLPRPSFDAAADRLAGLARPMSQVVDCHLLAVSEGTPSPVLAKRMVPPFDTLTVVSAPRGGRRAQPGQHAAAARRRPVSQHSFVAAYRDLALRVRPRYLFVAGSAAARLLGKEWARGASETPRLLDMGGTAEPPRLVRDSTGATQVVEELGLAEPAQGATALKYAASASIVIAGSEGERERFEEMLPAVAVVAVVPDGLDTTSVRLLPLPSPLTVGVFGRLDSQAFLESLQFYLEEVHPRVVRQVRGCRLVLAGTGTSPALSRLVREHPGVSALGPVEAPEIFFQRVRAMVNLVGSAHAPRGSTLRGLAHGRPHVLSSEDASALGGRDGEHFVVADDPDAVASGLVDLLTDRDRAKAIGRSGRRLVEDNHDWKVLARPILEYLAGQPAA